MIKTGRYDFLAQDSVLFGTPCVAAVMQTVEELAVSRVFLVSSQALSRETDAVSSIIDALGNRFCGLFDQCVAHVPRDSVIRALAAMYLYILVLLMLHSLGLGRAYLLRMK